MKEVVTSPGAPAAIGPYSQAIRAGGLLFLSGQIGTSPQTGDLVGDDVQSQTRRAIGNLEAVLLEAGATLGDLVKTTIYLTDLDDFATVNAIYGERVGAEPPARATVEVAGLPKGARVEIDGIAAL